MNLSKQVVSLEQAKRLKELGVEQTGYFMWQETGDPDPNMPQETIGRYDKEAYENVGVAPAFTVAELSQMLPTLGIKRCKSNNGNGRDYHWLEYRSEDWSDLSESTLLAKFLIYLLENKLTSPEECNKRLTQ